LARSGFAVGGEARGRSAQDAKGFGAVGGSLWAASPKTWRPEVPNAWVGHLALGRVLASSDGVKFTPTNSQATDAAASRDTSILQNPGEKNAGRDGGNRRSDGGGGAGRQGDGGGDPPRGGGGENSATHVKAREGKTAKDTEET